MDAQTVIAKRIALELQDGTLVNLGIGIPTRVANYVPAGIKVYFQSENGLIGTGAIPAEGMHHRLLTDAGGRPVTALPGACTFALLRGVFVATEDRHAAKVLNLDDNAAALYAGRRERARATLR